MDRIKKRLLDQSFQCIDDPIMNQDTSSLLVNDSNGCKKRKVLSECSSNYNFELDASNEFE